MEKIIYGLVKGRHELPCDKYLFDDEIENVHDYHGIYKKIEFELYHNLTWWVTKKDYKDNFICQSSENLVVYVTGLTPVVVELIRCCINNHIPLTLMNYDTSTGEYIPQQVVLRI